jgi:phenylalanyl-tRNA synthetase beta chain
MKVPLSWLHDYVDLNLPVAQLVERLTLAGLEVSGVRLIGVPPPEGLRVKGEDAGPVWDRDKIVIAQILGVEQHPNADKLTLPTVDLGGGKTKQLLTGAPNIKVGDRGQKVIVALTGSVLYDGHAKEKVLAELKPTKIRGIPSDAMVCSAYELGISDEHEGIIILEDDAPVGMPLVDYMGDIVLEIDVLPNMARCLSMIGVAREVAAIVGAGLPAMLLRSETRGEHAGPAGTGNPLRYPPHVVQEGEPIEGKVKVVIQDPALSARYAALLMEGITVGPAPGWMQRRLAYAGMRPIDNIVDITNYVMLEWGQPLHAFDHDRLTERAGGKVPTITVRPAREGEVLVTLDGNERRLGTQNLVIADEKGPIALAGVMGGRDTEVSRETRNVLLESANFDFVSIRKTARQFDLPSEASARFSRGIHPELVKPAAERAGELMRQHGGATVCKGMVDTYPAPLPPQVIELKMPEVRRQLGTDIPLAEATRVLKSLEFGVEAVGADTLKVTTPPHRVDIQEGPADLIEELARIHGYDRLPATLLADQLPEQHGNRALALEEHTRDLLVNAGLQEVITYALTIPEREKPLGLPEAGYVRLRNPISSEREVMRHSVLASVLEVVAKNLQHTEDVRLFEIGTVYLPKEGRPLPEEQPRLALVITGWCETESWQGAGERRESLDFWDIKGVVESLASDLHLPEVSYRKSAAPYLHPGKAADLVVAGKTVGHFGQLHPRVARAYHEQDWKELDSSGRTVLVGEFDLEALLAEVPARYVYTLVPRFPAAKRDIAVIVDEAVTAEQVLKEIAAAGKPLLSQARLFDLYRGESIPEGTKSLAYALTYQPEDRTLKDEEVDRAHKKIEDRLKHVLKAQIRGQETTGKTS